MELTNKSCLNLQKEHLMSNYMQANIFDYMNTENHTVDSDVYCNITLPQNDVVSFDKYQHYNLDEYISDILTIGLEQTWTNIVSYALNDGSNNFLSPDNFAELYETGLAVQDKYAKKGNGQYYTPDDVAKVMAKWFDGLQGEAVCDVACGTGKLILTYLDMIGFEKARALLRKGLVYLYDIDKVALTICKTILVYKYGNDIENKIHTIQCDFLSKNVVLPKNCKVISNPPYAAVSAIANTWEHTEVVNRTKELYSMFMEKIITQSKCSVIISPYSFLGGNKFYPLRSEMNNYNGFIVSFDNVPGNIFCGRKHGIFNTNAANSVRAAITVVENKKGLYGFRLSPLIRFKNEERTKLLDTTILESFVSENYQIVSDKKPMYERCINSLSNVWKRWNNYSKTSLKYYISQSGEYTLSMPNTCRYYTTASTGIMNRNGQIVLSFRDKDVYDFTFCLINSSFAYWYWRNYDGGITYPKGLLLNMPMFYDKLTDDDKQFFDKMATEMIELASQFTVTKNNVGIQENIKYPRTYRDRINRRLLDILECNESEKEFDVVHSNMAFEVSL